MEKILVALDPSPRAPDVLKAAAELAQRTNAKLTLLRVYGVPVGIPVEAFAYVPEELTTVLEKESREALERLGKAVSPEQIAGIKTALGTPWQQICDVAMAEKADLIVIGSHGYGGLDRLLGTTAGRVVNHAECSVLVVRLPSDKDKSDKSARK